MRVFLTQESKYLKVAISPQGGDELEIKNFFYAHARLSISKACPPVLYLSGEEFSCIFKKNTTGLYDVKASAEKFLLDGEEIPILPVNQELTDPDEPMTFSLIMTKHSAKLIDTVMEKLPSDQWVTISATEEGVEILSSNEDFCLLAKVTTTRSSRNGQVRRGVKLEEFSSNSISFPKKYWDRVTPLLESEEVQAFRLQSGESGSFILSVLTQHSRLVGLVPLDAMARSQEPSPVALSWYSQEDSGKVVIDLEESDKAKFAKAVESVNGESIDLVPVKDGLQIWGTDFVFPVPSGMNEKITVQKSYLMAALLSSSLGLSALIVGVHLPFTLQLVKAGISVLLALKAVCSPVNAEDVAPPQEVGKKAKKKKLKKKKSKKTKAH